MDAAVERGEVSRALPSTMERGGLDSDCDGKERYKRGILPDP